MNIQGMKKVEKRPEVEMWMKQNKVNLMGLVETHIGETQQERRNNYTW